MKKTLTTRRVMNKLSPSTLIPRSTLSLSPSQITQSPLTVSYKEIKTIFYHLYWNENERYKIIYNYRLFAVKKKKTISEFL